jgi:hypothetical protein
MRVLGHDDGHDHHGRDENRSHSCAISHDHPSRLRTASYGPHRTDRIVRTASYGPHRTDHIVWSRRMTARPARNRVIVCLWDCEEVVLRPAKWLGSRRAGRGIECDAWGCDLGATHNHTRRGRPGHQWHHRGQIAHVCVHTVTRMHGMSVGGGVPQISMQCAARLNDGMRTTITRIGNQ